MVNNAFVMAALLQRNCTLIRQDGVSTSAVWENNHLRLLWETLAGSLQTFVQAVYEIHKWQPLMNFNRNGRGVEQQTAMPHGLQGKIQEKTIFFSHAIELEFRYQWQQSRS